MGSGGDEHVVGQAVWVEVCAIAVVGQPHGAVMVGVVFIHAICGQFLTTGQSGLGLITS